MKLVEFDRHLGALFGGVKGVLFTTVLTVALLCVYPSAAGMIVHSESRGVAENVIGFVSPLLPKNVQEVIAPYLKPIEDLPDDEPRRPVVNHEDAEDSHAPADTPDDTFTPRRRRSQTIYEDDLTKNDNGLGDLPPSTDRPPRRRYEELTEDRSAPKRRRSSDDYSGELDSASGDDAFGIDPSQAFEDDTPTKRR